MANKGHSYNPLPAARWGIKNVLFNGEQEKEFIVCVRIEKAVTHDHRLPSHCKLCDAKG